MITPFCPVNPIRIWHPDDNSPMGYDGEGLTIRAEFAKCFAAMGFNGVDYSGCEEDDGDICSIAVERADLLIEALNKPVDA